MRDKPVGLIGAGRMAEAIARGMLEAALVPADALFASDPSEARREVFRSLGARITDDNLAVAGECPVLIMAVKPQDLDQVLRQIGCALGSEHLLITICAGCPTSLFEAVAAAPLRVVRAMPNLPVRVRMGATALCAGRHATAADMALAAEVFGSAGTTVVVEESLMNAVTAVSGSGPAYFYFLAETLIEAGRREGLPADMARRLAIQTARGAAEMMAVEDAPPEALRRNVTSKGGTTEAAFRSMEASGVRQALIEAIGAAAERARELGK